MLILTTSENGTWAAPPAAGCRRGFADDVAAPPGEERHQLLLWLYFARARSIPPTTHRLHLVDRHCGVPSTVSRATPEYKATVPSQSPLQSWRHRATCSAVRRRLSLVWRSCLAV